MVTSEYAINYIKTKLVELVDSGKLKATYNQSKTSVSFYVNDIETPKRPLLTLTLRLTDHHPDLQDYIGNKQSVPSYKDNANISVEFYQPMFDVSGKIRRNRFNSNVRTKDDVIILPFTVTYFEYKPKLLEESDVKYIYDSILEWICNNEEGGTFVDPLKGTPKEAKTETKTAKIKTDFTNYASYRTAVRYKQNQEDGWDKSSQAEINWWRTKGIGDSKNRKGKVLEKKQKNKTIIISEEKEQQLIGDILTETFYPSSEKVLIIKDYLDKNFARQLLDNLDDNGYPTKEITVVMMSADKQPLKTLNMKEFLRLLDDKFIKMMSDKEDRKKFLKQVIKDWYYNKIDRNGLLSVNYL